MIFFGCSVMCIGMLLIIEVFVLIFSGCISFGELSIKLFFWCFLSIFLKILIELINLVL